MCDLERQKLLIESSWMAISITEGMVTSAWILPTISNKIAVTLIFLTHITSTLSLFPSLRSPFSPLLQNNVVMWFHELLANTEWGRGSVNDLLVECGGNKSVVLHINKTLQTCQLILTLIVGPQYEDLDIGMNPFHFQYLISNSLYCPLYNSHNLNLENLVLDQLVTPSLIFSFIHITFLLDLTNRGAMTALCFVVEHAGSSLSMKEM